MDGVAKFLDRAGRMPDLQHLDAFAFKAADHVIIVTDDDQRGCVDDEDLPDRIQEIQEVHPQAVFLKAGQDIDQPVSPAFQRIMDQLQIAFQRLALQRDKRDLIFPDRPEPDKYAADAQHDIEDQLFQLHDRSSPKTMSMTRCEA